MSRDQLIDEVFRARGNATVFQAAESALSDAYLRLRTLIPGALDTPPAPSAEVVWATTEAALRALLIGGKAVEAAVMTERERCAKIADAEAAEYDHQRVEFNGNHKFRSGDYEATGWMIHARLHEAQNIAALIRLEPAPPIPERAVCDLAPETFGPTIQLTDPFTTGKFNLNLGALIRFYSNTEYTFSGNRVTTFQMNNGSLINATETVETILRLIDLIQKAPKRAVCDLAPDCQGQGCESDPHDCRRVRDIQAEAQDHEAFLTTPGPWVWAGRALTGRDGDIVLWPHNTPDEPETWAERLGACGLQSEARAAANATLIAAAPALLLSLIRLSNEVLGAMSLYEAMARREMGNTNYNILVQRAEEARALILSLKPQKEPKR